MPEIGPAHQPILALIEAWRYREAHARLLAMAARKPDAVTHYLLGLTSTSCGDAPAAAFHTARAVRLSPGDPDMAAAYVQALAINGRAAEGARVAAEAIGRLGPAPALLLARAECLNAAKDYDAAVAAADEARASGAEARECQIVAAVALCSLGRFDEARERFFSVGAVAAAQQYGLGVTDVGAQAELTARQAREQPDEPSAHSTHAILLNYHDGADARGVAAAHAAFGRAVAARVPRVPPPRWAMSRDPGRVLRVGIVSPDLRRHAVVSFLRPLLENYDRSRLRVHAYSTCTEEDEVSAELRPLADRWTWMRMPHPGVVVETLRADAIDVAIDLAGHTAGNSLEAFLLRCAPVQLTYLGYPHSTGLSAIDARVVDSITDPPGHEAYSTERLARIDPCFLCYSPLREAPEVSPGPGARGGAFTFGSFNFVQKISPTILGAWARVLAAAPRTRLVLKSTSFKNPALRDRTLARLTAGGVDASRIEILPPTPDFRSHLAAYEKMDVALDTYPYHGTTTTSEALWMGVPVITLAGDRHAARVGPSLLSAAGLGDLSADSIDAFVELAVSMTERVDQLRAWRTPGPGSLRAKVAASPLCDGPAFARRFEAMLRDEWRRWCTSATADAKGDAKGPPTVARR